MVSGRRVRRRVDADGAWKRVLSEMLAEFVAFALPELHAAIDWSREPVFLEQELRPVAGQTIFLKRGHGTMRFGADTIRLGPGNDAHRTWQMRHTEPPAGHVRVLVPFFTPVDHAFAVRVGRGV